MATSHAQDIARDSARVDQFETWLGSYQEVSHDQHIYIYICMYMCKTCFFRLDCAEFILSCLYNHVYIYNMMWHNMHGII